MSAFVFQNLGFDLGPRKLVIFRTDRAGSDLPHLTLSWGNRSKEIELHFTPLRAKSADDREILFKASEAQLSEFLTSLGQNCENIASTRLLTLFFPVRGHWLRRNYYKVLQPQGETIEKWFLSAIPRVRGKYRADIHTLKQIPKNALRQPTTGRLAELKEANQVWAVCTRGYNKGHVLVLHHMLWRFQGPTWLAVDYEDAPEFCNAFSGLLSDRLDTLVSTIIGRVRDTLRLEEIGW